MIITVGNTKGGVGKTTIALNLAIARAMEGSDVWLVDGDRQGTAETALAIRAESGKKPGIACAKYDNGSTLRTQLKQQAHRFTDVIIDVGGRDSSALRAALIISDVLLVPFQPRSYDVWALADIAVLVEEARAVRDGLQAYAFLNLADPGMASADNREAATAVENFPAFVYLNAPVRRRKALANAAGQGLSVFEMIPKDPKACAELRTLISLVFNIPQISL